MPLKLLYQNQKFFLSTTSKQCICTNPKKNILFSFQYSAIFLGGYLQEPHPVHQMQSFAHNAFVIYADIDAVIYKQQKALTVTCGILWAELAPLSFKKQ